MVILGLTDGAEPGAALVIDGAPPRWAPGPVWEAALTVSTRAGLEPGDIDVVAVAGRFTPSLAARMRGEAGRGDPFGPRSRMSARWERMLRATGLGAMDADAAAEWFEGQLQSRGYRPRRVRMVDLHACASGAAYRTQPDDQTLVAVVLPRGDGAFATLHRGHSGTIERLSLEPGPNAVHLWSDRACGAVGLTDRDLALAGGAADPDPELVARLGRTFRREHGRFAARRLEVRAALPWADLGRLPRAVAAATVSRVFREAALAWLAEVAQRHPGQPLTLGGQLALDPQLVAAAAELPGVPRVWAGPWTGGAALAVGAALTLGGRPPGLDPEGDADDEPIPDGVVVSEPDLERLVNRLASGGAVARFVGATPGVAVSPTRAVLARADRPDAIAHARSAVRRAETEDHLRVELPGPAEHPLSGPLRCGLAAVDGARTGWADPGLVRVLEALRARTGCGAVAAVPLGIGGDPAAADLAGAVQVWRASGLPLLDLGARGWASPVGDP